MAFTPGTRVGPYEIHSAIGAGGMGEVYLAEDLRLRRKVALKRLAPERLERPGARGWLLHEARAVATLSHPNIAAIFDVLEIGDAAWIVMEYVPGETLNDRVRRGKLPVDQVIAIGIQLADALADAHARGVIHRDLKPSNIRLTADGRAKILDFGIAQMPPPDVDPDAGTAEPVAIAAGGLSIGTPGYAAPEQLLARPIDARVDIYGLGIVLFEILTGHRPYLGADVVGLALSALTQPTPDPTVVAPEIPADLAAIVKKAMAGDPDARFQSAADLRAALQRVGAGSADTMPTVPTTVPASPRARRSPLRRAIAAVALVATAALAGWMWRSRTTASPPPAAGALAVVVLPLANLSGNPANDYLGVGVAETLTSDLAGLPGVTVVSTASTGPRPGPRDYARIARDVGVSFIIDGSVQRTDDRVKLTARLVRRDGSVAWGDSFEGSIDQLFAIENRLAQSVSDALDLRPSDSDRAKLGRQPTADMEAFAEYAQGRALLDRRDVPGNVDRAIDRFNAAAEKDRRFALAQAGLGEAYWENYRRTKDSAWTTKARAATLEALRLDPDQADVRYSLAVIYRGTGDTERAIEELHHALTLRHNFDDAHRMLGEILSDKGQIDAAVGEFQQAIALRPTFQGNHDALGLTLYRAGRFKDAAEAFERVTQLQPDNANGFQRLGTAYHAAGDTTKALANYQRALELAPTPKAYANLGFFYYSQGRFADAATAYKQALALDPASHVTYRNLGDVYLRLGKHDEARASYAKGVEITERMLQINASDAQTIAHRALYEAKLGRRAAAAQHAKAAVDLAPADGQVLYAQAVVLALAGEIAPAMQALERALAHGASASVARADDDLAAIRGTPAFQKLTAEKQ